MGIDFRIRRDEALTMPHWSYGGFNTFRRRLAQVVGLENIEVFWDLPEDHPLHPLLNHSDCDGELTPQECQRVYHELRRAVASWPYEDYDRINGARLADAMEYCAKNNSTLVFC